MFECSCHKTNGWFLFLSNEFVWFDVEWTNLMTKYKNVWWGLLPWKRIAKLNIFRAEVILKLES